MAAAQNESLSKMLTTNKPSMASTKNQINNASKKQTANTRISHVQSKSPQKMHKVQTATQTYQQNATASKYQTVRQSVASPEHSNRDIDDVLSQKLIPEAKDDHSNVPANGSDSGVKPLGMESVDDQVDLVEKYPIPEGQALGESIAIHSPVI